MDSLPPDHRKLLWSHRRSSEALDFIWLSLPKIRAFRDVAYDQYQADLGIFADLSILIDKIENYAEYLGKQPDAEPADEEGMNYGILSDHRRLKTSQMFRLIRRTHDDRPLHVTDLFMLTYIYCKDSKQSQQLSRYTMALIKQCMEIQELDDNDRNIQSRNRTIVSQHLWLADRIKKYFLSVLDDGGRRSCYELIAEEEGRIRALYLFECREVEEAKLKFDLRLVEETIRLDQSIRALVARSLRVKKNTVGRSVYSGGLGFLGTLYCGVIMEKGIKDATLMGVVWTEGVMVLEAVRSPNVSLVSRHRGGL